MRVQLYLITLITLTLSTLSCYKDEILFNPEPDRYLEVPLLLKMNDINCGYDHETKSLRFPISQDELTNGFHPFITFQEYSTIYFNDKKLENNELNNLGTIDLNNSYDIKIISRDETYLLKLTFTNLPLVQLVIPNEINDDPQTIAKLTINTNTADTYFTGIEFRGGSSQAYNKKSYGLSLKKNQYIDTDISDQLLDMRSNNDWILDAMYVDKTRLRNKTSFEIWNTTNKENNHGIQSRFVELYINTELQGLYCLNENINAELLNLTSEDAVLYKATAWEDGATRFETLSEEISNTDYWDGWEQKYPKTIINWAPLHQLRDLVINKNDEEFSSEITSLIDLNNFIDYYIFLNITSAWDNTGKNTFLSQTKQNEKIIITPWDLDGSWGVFWNGEQTGFDNTLSNNLYNRLFELNPDDFKEKTKLRWNELRSNVYSTSSITNTFVTNFSTIKKSNIIDIENNKWDANITIEEEETYLLDWTNQRLSFLDDFFNNL